MDDKNVKTIVDALNRLGIEAGANAKVNLQDLADNLTRMADEIDNRNFDKRFRISKIGTGVYFRDYIDNKDRGIDVDMLRDLLTLSFMKNRENLVFWGNPGTGKSWLAKMIATAACMANKRVRWIDFPVLYRQLDRLKKKDENKYETKIKYYINFDLLCIDEFLNYKQEDPYIMQEFFKRAEDLGKCTLVICCQANPENWVKLFDVGSFGQSVRGRIVSKAKKINTLGKDMRLAK